MLTGDGQSVALRKESVDRNLLGVGCLIMIGVALRKESVDRNSIFDFLDLSNVSLSARRAWIEILLVYLALIRYLSLSARRAWIEIVMQEIAQQRKQVALRKESVDRNPFPYLLWQFGRGRSPQGERG